MTEQEYLTKICKGIETLDNYRNTDPNLKDIGRGHPVIDTLLILEDLLDDFDKVEKENK